MSSEEQEVPQEEESTTIEDQEVEEEKPPRKIIKTSKTVSKDYEKMNTILMKQTGIKEKQLEGLSPKERFDRLSFYAEHSKAVRNEKIIPSDPLGGRKSEPEGITIMEHPLTGRKTYSLDPKTLFKQKK